MKGEELVDKIFEECDKPGSPGCALGVIWNGKLIYARGYGMANLDYDIPITPKTVFRIASVSKQFTATCIALLIERGLISMEDEVRKFIPELPEYGYPVKVKHLIYHTSGIRDYLDLMSMAYKRDEDYYTPEEALEMICRQKKLNFKPGSRFLYSNSNYFLLGVIVERASGISLRKFADENIFKPLGMKNTHFHDDHTMIVKNRAIGYSPRPDGGFRVNETSLDIVGDGGLFTTVEDLYIWDQNFYHNKLEGGRRLIRRILTVGTLNSGEKLDYAFGLRIGSYRGLRIVHHSGSFAGFRAQMIRFPEQKFTVICLANLSSINPTRLAKEVADIYLAEYLMKTVKIKFIELPVNILRGYVGVFRDENGFTCKTYIENNILTLEFYERKIKLKPTSKNKFKSIDSPIQLNVEFKRIDDEPLKLILRIEDRKPQIYKAIKPVTPTTSQLREYVGQYYSDELRVTYKIELENGELKFKHKNAPKKPLTPTIKDEFTVGYYTIKFIRDGEGKVSGFNLNTTRSRNVAFIKIKNIETFFQQIEWK